MAGLARLLLVLSGVFFVVNARLFQNTQKSEKYNIYKYNSYDKILAHVHRLAVKNSHRVKVDKIGTTFEGRDLVLARVSCNFSANNPVILVDAGAHAREWASIAVGLALLESLVRRPASLLTGVDWHIIPLVNPDGYEYTRLYDRMWRKNRVRHTKVNCYGTDLNRNYGFHWAESGVSNDPCDLETYPGPAPFSELETQAVRSVMQKYADRIKLYTSLHAYGKYMVYPYGYTGAILPDSWKKLRHFATAVTDEAKKVYGSVYKVLSAGEWYPGAGGSDDYAFGVIGVPYSYTLELTDGYQFEYPERRLGKLYRETTVLFATAAKLINEEFGNKCKNATLLMKAF